MGFLPVWVTQSHVCSTEDCTPCSSLLSTIVLDTTEGTQNRNDIELSWLQHKDLTVDLASNRTPVDTEAQELATEERITRHRPTEAATRVTGSPTRLHRKEAPTAPTMGIMEALWLQALMQW